MGPSEAREAPAGNPRVSFRDAEHRTRSLRIKPPRGPQRGRSDEIRGPADPAAGAEASRMVLAVLPGSPRVASGSMFEPTDTLDALG
jgi:hypothetical protein